MSTDVVTVEVAPRTVAELMQSLEPQVFRGGRGFVHVVAGDASWLRVETPLRQSGWCFESSPNRCAWKTPEVSVSVRLSHLFIEQSAGEDVLQVVFRQAPVPAALALDLAQHATSRVREIFLARGLRALGSLNELDENTLVEATKEASDFSVLVSALTAEEALAPVRTIDPLASARLRGIEAKRKLLLEDGGCVSSTEAAALLKVSRQAVDKRRGEGKLLALSLGKKGYYYPKWQFGLSGVERVLAVLGGLDAWQKLSFFVNPNDMLRERSPLEVLRDGLAPVATVEEAAGAYGEHGA